MATLALLAPQERLGPAVRKETPASAACQVQLQAPEPLDLLALFWGLLDSKESLARKETQETPDRLARKEFKASLARRARKEFKELLEVQARKEFKESLGQLVLEFKVFKASLAPLETPVRRAFRALREPPALKAFKV